MQNKKEVLEASLESALDQPKNSAVNDRLFETDKCEMNRLANSLRNATIDKIVFKCTEGASNISVIGLNEHNPVKTTSIILESSYNVPTEKYLKMLVRSSKLNDAKFGDSIPAIESWIDGRHTSLR